MKRKFIRDQTAEGYIDVAITILILFTLMASIMALFPIFTAQQSLNQTAKYTARTIELCGKADDTYPRWVQAAQRPSHSPIPHQHLHLRDT